MFQLLNGQFQFVGGGLVANGSVKLVLSDPTAIIIATGASAPASYTFNLDANANMPANASAWGNYELSVNGVPGTTVYTVTVYTGANLTGSVAYGPYTAVVGPAAPYFGMLFPNLTVIPLINISTVDGVLVTGVAAAGTVIMATSPSTGSWQFPVVATAAVANKFVTAIDHTGAATLAQPAFTNISGVVAAAQLPNPGAASLGGVQSKAVVASNFLTGISTAGVVTAAQPAFSDISGTIAAAQLPAPTATTLGGVKSLAVVANNFLTGISTAGAVTQARPAFTDISGVATAAQLPNPAAASLGGVQSKAVVASNFLTGISTAGVVTAAQPAFTDISGTATAAQLPNPAAAAKGGVFSKAAVANQFLTSISSVDGSIGQAQPSAANLSDGLTGTGTVVRATSPTIASPTLSGTTLAQRIKVSQGTALVAGDFSLVGFGSTATVTGILGTDQAFTASINCAGASIAANPTITLTFHDGTWTTVPIYVVVKGDGASPQTGFWIVQAATSATQLVLQMVGLPITATTYVIWVIGMGR